MCRQICRACEFRGNAIPMSTLSTFVTSDGNATTLTSLATTAPQITQSRIPTDGDDPMTSVSATELNNLISSSSSSVSNPFVPSVSSDARQFEDAEESVRPVGRKGGVRLDLGSLASKVRNR